MTGCDNAGMAERSYPESEVRGGGREEPPRVQGQGQRPRGATALPRPGTVAGRSNPKSKEWWLCRYRRAERSCSMLKIRRGGSEEIPLRPR